MKFRQMISGAVCMAVAVSSMSVLESVVADAVNLENVASIIATSSGTLENGLNYEVYEDHVEITGCDSSLEGEMIIPETIEGLPVTSIKERALFQSCSSLTSIIIPNSVTSIGDWAFQYFSSLTSITIPDSVTNIGGFAFMGCASLESLTIPKNVVSIGDWAFCDCNALESIQVAPENQNYMDVDGILFSKEQEVLVAYPAAKPEQSYSIPEGVTSIAKSAFWGSVLTSVTIPDNVTSIGDGAFDKCHSLKSITIPKSVTTIGGNAFARCPSLESITILNADCEIYGFGIISNTAVIYGYSGSTAQAYAEKHNMKFVALDENPGTTEPTTEPETEPTTEPETEPTTEPETKPTTEPETKPTTEPETVWGDISGDGATDITDVVFMNRVYVGVDKLPDGGLENADTDQDGKITLSDSMNVLRLLVHLLTPEDFPIQAES